MGRQEWCAWGITDYSLSLGFFEPWTAGELSLAMYQQLLASARGGVLPSLFSLGKGGGQEEEVGSTQPLGRRAASRFAYPPQPFPSTPLGACAVVSLPIEVVGETGGEGRG